MITQVSVFLENKEGRLAEVLEILYENSINLRSLTVAETADYGILRLIPDKPKETISRLKEAGFIVKETDVLAVEIEDTPGSMLCVVKELAKNNIDIQYVYSCLPVHQHNVIIVIRVNETEKAKEILANSDCALLLNMDDII